MIIFRIILGLISKMIAPRFSGCGRCGMRWCHTKEKTIYYSTFSGHFALCEHCYNNITIEEKIKYYTESKHDFGTKKNMISAILKDCDIEETQYYREQKLKRILK